MNYESGRLSKLFKIEVDFYSCMDDLKNFSGALEPGYATKIMEIKDSLERSVIDLNAFMSAEPPEEFREFHSRGKHRCKRLLREIGRFRSDVKEKALEFISGCKKRYSQLRKEGRYGIDELLSLAEAVHSLQAGFYSANGAEKEYRAVIDAKDAKRVLDKAEIYSRLTWDRENVGKLEEFYRDYFKNGNTRKGCSALPELKLLDEFESLEKRLSGIINSAKRDNRMSLWDKFASIRQRHSLP